MGIESNHTEYNLYTQNVNIDFSRDFVPFTSCNENTCNENPTHLENRHRVFSLQRNQQLKTRDAMDGTFFVSNQNAHNQLSAVSGYKSNAGILSLLFVHSKKKNGLLYFIQRLCSHINTIPKHRLLHFIPFYFFFVLFSMQSV